MNFKYYLRGLGIGILVTALIMGIATNNSKEALSNEEIIAKAKTLGMIEGSTLLGNALPSSTPIAEPIAEPAEESTEEVMAEPEEAEVEQAEEPEAKATPKPVTEATPKPTTEEVSEPATEATAEPMPTSTEKVTSEDTEETDSATTKSASGSQETIHIEVRSGEGSFTVCQKLEDAGLIAKASDFDRYLYQNGYDKKVRIGTYEIPADAEPEDIAKIITGGK